MTLEEFKIYIQQHGDNQACKRLYEVYSEKLIRIARKYSVESPSGIAMDIVADFWAHLQRNPNSTINSVEAYLVYMLKSKLNKERPAPDRAVPEGIEKTDSLEDSEQLAAIKEGLKQVSDKERTILELFYIKGWAIESIADEMDYTYASAKVTLDRARKSLRNVIQEL